MRCASFRTIINYSEVPSLNGFAGSDTLATAISASFFYLLDNPATLAELSAEIRATFPDVDDIRIGPKLSTCQYLHAVIDEAMRLSPSIAGILPREALAGGVQIDGNCFPAGTILGTPHYAIHHNEAYYPDPFTFNPSRWIEGREEATTTSSVKLAQSAFCPFSAGPRTCVGKSLAYVEMKIILARVVWLYEMRLKEGSNLGAGNPTLGSGRTRSNEFQMLDKFSSKTDGPMVEFKARERLHS